MTREFEIRLLDHDSPDGELLAADALALISSFKDVAYRLTRSIADRPGLGRTDAVLEELATVRVGLRPGSTRVVFVVGDAGALVDPLAQQVDEAFWSIVDSLDSNERPEAISDSVAESVDRLVVALQKAAPRAEILVPGHRPKLLVTRGLSRLPWQQATPESADETLPHGMFEMEARPDFGVSSSIEELLRQARDVPIPPPLELADEELDEFLAVIRGSQVTASTSVPKAGDS